MPRVSILTPLYKSREEHLRETIESVLAQTFQDFELLLLNDSPDDDTRLRSIVAEYQDARIRYMCNAENLGISASRNKLIEAASGDYLAVLDHDDLMLPERLRLQVEYLDAHPDVGVVGSMIEYFPGGKRPALPVDDDELRLNLMYGCVLAHTSAMIRKAVLEQTGIRYEAAFSPSEDHALWVRLLPHTRLHNLPEVLVKYRRHESNTTNLLSGKMRNSAEAVCALAKITCPLLYEEYLRRARHIVQIKLFGFLTLLSMKGIHKRDSVRWKVYLFGLIPLITYKTAVRF